MKTLVGLFIIFMIFLSFVTDKMDQIRAEEESKKIQVGFQYEEHGSCYQLANCYFGSEKKLCSYKLDCGTKTYW